MERQRKYKIFSIIALMFAIAGMSLGFAAFSKVLTINASATVTPNEEDFKVVTYGFKDKKSLDIFDYTGEWQDDHLSSEKSVGSSIGNVVSSTDASITNSKNNTIISNIDITFNGDNSTFYYYFIVKKEGQYDAYINLEEFENYSIDYKTYNGTCTAIEENANQEAINTACQNIEVLIALYNEMYGDLIQGTEIEPYYKLTSGDYILIEFQVATNDNAVILEPYTVEFEDITINFSTAP